MWQMKCCQFNSCRWCWNQNWRSQSCRYGHGVSYNFVSFLEEVIVAVNQGRIENMASYFSYFIDYDKKNYSVNIYLWYLQTSPGERWMWRYQPKDTSTSIFHKSFHKQLIGKKEANKDGYDGNCNQYFASRFTFLLPQNGFNIQVCCSSLIYYLLFDFWNTYIQQSNMTL